MTEPSTYHITCNTCDLNDIIETLDWRVAGLRIHCCVCGVRGTIAIPENDARVTCKSCGAETLVIKKVDTEV